MMRCGRYLFFFIVGAMVSCYGGLEAAAGQCKAKSAGFFLQFPEFASPTRLSSAIQGYPESLTGLAGNAINGRDVLISQQKGACLSCHKISSLGVDVAQGAMGPALDGIGGKYSEGQLRLWVVEPTAYAPKTIMPSYFKKGGAPGSSVLAAAEVEDLLAYLKTLK